MESDHNRAVNFVLYDSVGTLKLHMISPESTGSVFGSFHYFLRMLIRESFDSHRIHIQKKNPGLKER